MMRVALKTHDAMPTWAAIKHTKAIEVKQWELTHFPVTTTIVQRRRRHWFGTSHHVNGRRQAAVYRLL